MIFCFIIYGAWCYVTMIPALSSAINTDDMFERFFYGIVFALSPITVLIALLVLLFKKKEVKS